MVSTPLPNKDLLAYITAFIKEKGLPAKDFSCLALAGDGSQRHFWRVRPDSTGISFVIMENPPADEPSRRENFAYLQIGRHLLHKGVPTPEIYRADLRQGWFIMEDLGDRSLQEEVSGLDNPLTLYKKVADILFHLQINGAKGFDRSWTCQTERYDWSVMRRFESDYFREAFLGLYLKLDQDWSHLNRSFESLADAASRADGTFFLHRDFQSRNILVTKGNIRIIDWQGGRLGPLGYDLASLLIDPYVSLNRTDRESISRYYLKIMGDHRAEWVEPFIESFPYLAIQRNLQILGAFAFLSRVRGKNQFAAYIDPALGSLHQLLIDLSDPRLSPLLDLIEELITSRR